MLVGNKKIAFDLDGVVFDNNGLIHEYLGKFLYEKGINLEIDPTKYDVEDMVAITKEEAAEFWSQYTAPVLLGGLRSGMKEVIDILKFHGYYIYGISARDCEYSNITEESIIENELNFDEVRLGCREKAELLKILGVGTMIEDSTTQITDIQNKYEDCTILVFHKEHNEDIQKTDNTFRIQSSWDILRVLNIR